ncbi:hypothetical protein [Pseudomonas sp. 2FE]|uniref:hypothetical protein n=1 Tax=Pseudomonas sp. 2FE TaxID=2502190 RepID=UPI0010F7A467|nr:hypothetical protein [Pseudomonas sp. 2FE]
MQDERFYTQVSEELKHQPVIPGLWAKAYAESNGNEAQAKALYIRSRAEQLEKAEQDLLQEYLAKKKRDELLCELKQNYKLHIPFLALAIVYILVTIAAW